MAVGRSFAALISSCREWTLCIICRTIILLFPLSLLIAVITYCCWWFLSFITYLTHSTLTIGMCLTVLLSRLWCWYRPGVSGTPPTPVLTSWPCRTEPVISGPGQDILGINVTFPPRPNYLFPLFLQLSLPLSSCLCHSPIASTVFPFLHFSFLSFSLLWASP